jgi:hypothetical protein
MGNIVVGRYGPDEGTIEPDGSIRQHWQGWIEPEDLSWIAFVDMEGRPTFFLNRDPETGAVLEAA